MFTGAFVGQFYRHPSIGPTSGMSITFMLNFGFCSSSSASNLSTYAYSNDLHLCSEKIAGIPYAPGSTSCVLIEL